MKNLTFPLDFTDYLANLFREIRLHLDLTQEEMAKILGTSQRVYQRWETGHSEPTGQFTAKLFLIKEYLYQKKSSMKFDTPNEIAKKIFDEIGTQQDIHLLIKQTAEPVIILLKDLLYYSHHLGHSAKNSLNRPPFHIEWLPDSSSGRLSVDLDFKGYGKQVNVLTAYHVYIITNFTDVRVNTYLPGEWVFILKEALDVYKSHSYMKVDDSSLILDMRKAFELDNSEEK